MTIGVITDLYPSLYYPSRGKFIQDDTRLLASSEDITVYLSTVRAPFFSERRKRSKNIVRESFPIIKVPYISFPKRRFPDIIRKNIIRALLPVLRNQLNDIYHIHGLYPAGLAIPKIKKYFGKTVLTIHGNDWYETRNTNSLINILDESLQAVDHITVADSKIQNDILKDRPFLSDKLSIIPNGVDTHFFQPSENKAQSKNKLGWPTGAIHLLSVANTWRIKGLDILLRTISINFNSNDYQWHLIAPRRDRKYFNELRKYVKLNNLKNIHFYPEQTREELLDFYQAADLFISPSRREAFGISIVEAASSGLPVVATKSGGPEQIVSSEVGLLAENENPESLAQTINQMVNNLESYSSTDIRENIISRFSHEKKKQRLLELYRQLLNAV